MLLSSFNYTSSQSSDEDLVILNHFPVDLDLLFCQDNATMLDEVLDGIENNNGILPLSPFGGFFTGSHLEGSDKWYFDSLRQLEIFCPHEGIIEDLIDSENSVEDIIDSNEVITDVSLYIDIGENCVIKFGHLTLLKSIYDEIESSEEYSLSANQHIGYQTDSGMGVSNIDFWYLVNYKGINPYDALDPSLQTELSDLYDIQYQSMKKSGLYPQSKINVETAINIENTIWGVWKYNTGPFDDYAEGDLTLGSYAFDIHTFFDRQFANPETYWKDFRDQDTNLTSDVLGIFRDNSEAEDVPGYNKTYISHVKLFEGTSKQGILEICTWDASDWSPINTTLCVKFEVSSELDGYIDDELIIEFFTTINQAEGSFTELNRTYIRYEFGLDESTSDHVSINYYTLIAGFVPIAIIIQTFYKRRKKSN